jgi:hypothetical protein
MFYILFYIKLARPINHLRAKGSGLDELLWEKIMIPYGIIDHVT